MTSISTAPNRRRACAVLFVCAAALMAGENYAGDLAYSLSDAVQAMKAYCFRIDECPFALRAVISPAASMPPSAPSIATADVLRDFRNAVHERMAKIEALIGLQ